ncbi:hypothetical protein PPL_07203 [Heterostelium album PN500]|uniref:Uncharacterized protein n=1 Tax=Heterostelium pallidum (strain ATCC 26659 / Pp 5 / PN500) TaxID=670386 RepID=D3BEN8_HETP5|nr:hypothetical protein PPL_07203 [Heterostelium album PN500]EFA80369.1 hypothetical protein PPL_07203 [Heterostelium album PN500]|eukprot:XP_020432489.1 hypothetical protein PPL_07203 [Heterostelium album PN500]
MVKNIIFSILLLQSIYIFSVQAYCLPSWTGIDCSVCTQNNTCGCENSMQFRSGKYYSCDSQVQLFSEYPSVSFNCQGSECALNVFAQNYNPGRYAPNINCKFSQCVLNGLSAQCASVSCGCRNCPMQTNALAVGVTGASSIQCTDSGSCKFFNTQLGSIVSMNPIPLQCSAGYCDNTPQVTPCNSVGSSGIKISASLSFSVFFVVFAAIINYLF